MASVRPSEPTNFQEGARKASGRPQEGPRTAPEMPKEGPGAPGAPRRVRPKLSQLGGLLGPSRRPTRTGNFPSRNGPNKETIRNPGLLGPKTGPTRTGNRP